MSIEIEHIDFKKNDYVFIRFAGSVEHSLTISWPEKNELPTISGPSNCKSKTFEISIQGMELKKIKP